MWCDPHAVVDRVQLKYPVYLTTADGKQCRITVKGTVQLTKYTSLTNVYLCPRFTTNLISFGKLLSSGYDFEWDRNKKAGYLIDPKVKKGANVMFKVRCERNSLVVFRNGIDDVEPNQAPTLKHASERAIREEKERIRKASERQAS